ncbi:unnamed protein product [Protopolystoma xenopodis]|uniref:Uncharacterized protein n=1 Tax=Protopolystoma xenopodis TaxID=117903 RepID=A0A448X899_9PLAT|nr:unnamed protein product [Protopolystoma xenopodis]
MLAVDISIQPGGLKVTIGHLFRNHSLPSRRNQFQACISWPASLHAQALATRTECILRINLFKPHHVSVSGCCSLVSPPSCPSTLRSLHTLHISMLAWLTSVRLSPRFASQRPLS